MFSNEQNKNEHYYLSPVSNGYFGGFFKLLLTVLDDFFWCTRKPTDEPEVYMKDLASTPGDIPNSDLFHNCRYLSKFHD